MSREESPTLRGGLYIWGLAAAWTVLVILLLGWDLRQLTRKSLECAKACACTHLEKDVLHRRWNASHGGVYVPVTEGTPPNPFLAHLPEREVRTPSGRLLTLMNPTYMTRQVYDLAKLSNGVKGQITSLKPLRPENAADAWETEALLAFEQGRAEVSGVVRQDGQDYLRLMRPLITERACLACHAAQGYKLGDIRGGISIAMPLAPFWGAWRHELLANSLGLGLLWLLGLLGICWGGRRLRRSLGRQQQSEKELRQAHGELERRVQERTAELAEANTILKEEIGERQRVEETLRRRIDLEQIISSISTEFVQLAGCEVDAGINRTLERIGEFAGVEYAFVLQFSPEGLASSTHEWCAPGLPSQRAAFQGMPLTTFPWSWEKLKRGESLQVPRLSDLPPEAAPEKETLISLGFQSFMAVPLLRGGEPLGTLGFTSTREGKPWAPEDFALLQVLAEIFVNALTRRQAEAALKESEAKYRLLVSQVPAVVFKGYADWSVDFFDNKIEALTGYSKAEFDARQVKWCEVIHPEDLEAARKVFLEALKTTRSYVREHRIRKKTGEISWVQGRGQIFLDAQGKVDYVSGLLFDISEHKQAEEALKEKERFLAGIFNSIQDGLSVIDTDFNILRVNPALARVYVRARPLAGKKCYQAYKGREEPCPVCPARRTLETGRAAFEVMPKEKDGEIRGWLEFYTFPWKDPGSGQLKGVINYIRDITDRKQAEEALRRSEEQLRQAVKMEAIGRLAGGVAHDFNNIMTAIRGHGELLLQNLEAEDPCRGDMAHILQAADRAASLTRQLLAFSRQQVCQPRVLDLNAVVENLDKMLKRMIGEDVDLVFVPGPELGRVRADPGQIEQIIMNLAVNARDAMPGGGKLTLETTNVELDREYARDHPEVTPGPYVLLALSDTGVGLDAEAKTHLFEPFFTTKDPGQGTGLGLSTVYGIVKQNQGHISVYSEPGQGATFKVYLPRVAGPGEAVEATPPAPPLDRGSETILLVEDEDLVRQVVRRMLERNGYQVLEAARGQEALRLSEDHPGPIHLVLTDVVMPGMNGRDTVTALLARRPEVRVLYMSGHTENAIVHHGMLETGLAFIQKPFKYEDLMAKVREILEGPSPPRG
jgi:PAS domain S-box-containing protein